MRYTALICVLGSLLLPTYPVSAQTGAAGKPECTAEKQKFKAWNDQMPGSAHKLIVTGQVQCPTTGWKVELVEAKPPGINPAILILQIEAQRPVNNAGNVVTDVPVRFEKPNGDAFHQVTVRGGGPEFTLDVEIVH